MCTYHLTTLDFLDADARRRRCCWRTRREWRLLRAWRVARRRRAAEHGSAENCAKQLIHLREEAAKLWWRMRMRWPSAAAAVAVLRPAATPSKERPRRSLVLSAVATATKCAAAAECAERFPAVALLRAALNFLGRLSRSVPVDALERLTAELALLVGLAARLNLCR